jgi:hypothetical protein
VPYGPQMRRQRRLMTRALGPASVRTFHPLLEIETRAFLRRLVRDLGGWRAQAARYGGSVTLLTMYGYRVHGADDPFLRLATECVDLLSMRIASTASLWLVDIIPART